jgi:hypothetical protein
MRRSVLMAAVLLLAFPALLVAAPKGDAPRLDPNRVPALPSHIERVAPSIVGIHVEVPSDRPSVATLGAEPGLPPEGTDAGALTRTCVPGSRSTSHGAVHATPSTFTLSPVMELLSVTLVSGV